MGPQAAGGSPQGVDLAVASDDMKMLLGVEALFLRVVRWCDASGALGVAPCRHVFAVWRVGGGYMRDVSGVRQGARSVGVQRVGGGGLARRGWF